MKKMLKIMAMVLVIATVVFAAGCSSKGPETGTENETPGVTEAVNGTAVIAENNTTVIAENNTTIMTGENTTVVAENNTTVA